MWTPPLIPTAANYPQRALARGIEGFVVLSFTVNEWGM
jgi:TonB family protein